MNNPKERTDPPSVRVATDIAQLAARAAAQIDNVILRRSTEVGAVRELAALLKDRVAVAGPKTSTAHFLDPSTVLLIDHALQETKGSVRTVQELVAEAQRMIASLKQPDDGAVEHLKSTRSFCVALSRAAAALDESVDERQEHPFRM
jgi:hypothetical protein